jgi:hypothetical protein
MFGIEMPGRSGAVRVVWVTPGTWTNCYLLEFPLDGYVVDILRGELSRLIFICSVSSDLPNLTIPTREMNSAWLASRKSLERLLWPNGMLSGSNQTGKRSEQQMLFCLPAISLALPHLFPSLTALPP